MQKVKNDIEIRNLGMKSLINTLGYAGMIRFLRQFSKGSGDYLELQEKIFIRYDCRGDIRKGKETS